jgi:hypothetical protein
MFMQVFIELARTLLRAGYLVHLYFKGGFYSKFKYLDKLMVILSYSSGIRS